MGIFHITVCQSGHNGCIIWHKIPTTNVKGRKNSGKFIWALSFHFSHNIKNEDPKEGVAFFLLQSVCEELCQWPLLSNKYQTLV